MRTRTVLTVVLVLGVTGCGTSVPQVATRTIRYVVENRTDQRVEVSRAGGGGGSLEAVVEPCAASVVEDVSLARGAALSVDGASAWQFDELPPSHISALHVIVESGAAVTVNTSENIPEVPATGLCD